MVASARVDVHKENIAIAVADSDGSAPNVVSEVPNDTSTQGVAQAWLGKVAEPRCC
jgi:hypothetical protein